MTLTINRRQNARESQSVNKMRTIISVLFVSIVAGSYALGTGGQTSFKYADKDVVEKQALLFELLQHPYQPGVSLYKPEYLNIVNSFDFEHSFEHFRNVDAVKEFHQFYKKGLIPFNELFSIYNEKHRQQAIALFHVFFYAKGNFILISSIFCRKEMLRFWNKSKSNN